MPDNPDINAKLIEWPEGTGMVYFGMSPWTGMWKSRHQLMSRFSKIMPVLYVEPWVGLRSLGTGRTRRSKIATDIFRSRTEHQDPNITVYRSPAYLPVSRSRSLAKISQKIWAQSVRRTMRKAGILKPIVWVSKPEMQFVIGQLGEIFSIYHIVDEYAGYTGMSTQARRRLAVQEADLLEKVDLTIVASPELAQTKQGHKRDILVLENGVEPQEYMHARQSASEPADLAAVAKPRIGYSGLIGKRLNLDLICHLARNRPDCSVVMIGKVDDRECEDTLAALRSLPNVYLLGEKLPTDVASYIVRFDIGLLPYAINVETQHISPIKMYEYWAAGIPVVSTAIPAAKRHSFAVNVADNCDEFLAVIDRILDDPVLADSDRLVELANENSWQSRVDYVSAELDSRIGVR